MAFWVVDGGRPLGVTATVAATATATGRGPYYVGGKRRVSVSEGGDGFTFDTKRTRFADELPYDAYDHAPISVAVAAAASAPSGYASSDHVSPYYPQPQSAFHSGVHIINKAYPHNHPFDHEDEFFYNQDIKHYPPLIHRPDSAPVKNLSFLVIRERSPTPEGPDFPSIDAAFGPAPEPRPGHVFGPSGPAPAPTPAHAPVADACAMERTASGLSISSDTTQPSLASLSPAADENDPGLLSDLAAARLVRDHVANFGSSRRRHRTTDSRHGRILRALINPKSRAAEFPLDNDALRSIFSAANELFFCNRLAGRVAWDWSHPASAQYQAHIVGTTAVRRSRDGGYETLIVLSSPILQDTKYNRRLLISTFLHEMIHSYLFVVCGLKARHEGGHTEGFRQIADTIDRWVGHSYLRLSEMDADLEHFREHPSCMHDQHQVRSRSADEHHRVPWRSERWEDGERDAHYPTELHPRPHPSLHDWERHGREGYRAHDVRRGISPYVY
ncbi:uncharacterized protein FTJAE_9744 [Fusarium tjaetaba]|uniref:SprT-like domain-containing protein n=1 Tax=Fusarium tjaetaba TaxID=1567544 RepID=A0A8H5R3Q9_9HYPO|nr:uncharacterized protein FTJAE_9744 [Fusarium tjaetaba]KAF5626277.1 hypothetical protein FTJAE_9744 [Fusarium tjaetaba]